MIRTIGAGIGVIVCFFYLGCGSIQVANASGGSNTVPLTITTKLLPSAIAGTPYVVVLDATGGTPSYTWSITSGNLPSGVSLSGSTGVISGTPAASGNYPISVKLTDASDPNENKSTTVTIAVAPPPLEITSATLPSATEHAAYSQSLQATGGTPSYTWSITSGKLPAGLSLTASTGVISGAPTTAQTASFTATVHDSERPAVSQSAAMTLVVAPVSLKIGTLSFPSGVSGTSYSQTLQVTGGEPGYIWSIASGKLPTGLTLIPATGTISGVPTTTGSSSFIAEVTDSSHPALTASVPMTILIAPALLTIAASILPGVTVGSPYSQTLQVSGGTAPYSWSIASGNLPTGLALASSGLISGIPTVSGTSSFTAIVTDSSKPAQSASRTATIVVAPSPLTVTAPVLPSVKVGTAYSQTLLVSGGNAPYNWSVGSGNLPAGLALSPTGVISGTTTASGTSAFSATVRDSSNPAQSAQAAGRIVVVPTPLTITSSNLPSDAVGSVYSQPLQAGGGTAPYTWSISSGSLPAGLVLTPSTGTISGTPTSAATATFTVIVTDSSNPTQTASAKNTITVTPRSQVAGSTPLTIISLTLPSMSLGSAYQQTMQATGGTAPYNWTVSSGQFPPGFALSPAGVIAGTPTASGTFSFTVAVSDSSSPIQTNSATVTIASAATPLTITTTSLVSASAGTSYSQTLQATGGTPAYSWSISSGALPAGLTLATSTGVISGTPTATTASNFTVTVNDSSSPTQTKSAAMSIVTAVAPLAITSSSLISGTNGTAYSQALTASGGTPAYTWSVTSGSLPAGLTLAATTGVISGTPTASATSSFTATVRDNGNPVQTQSATTSISVVAPQPTGAGTTWFVRPDGGTRYSSNVPSGQCDGQADAAYPGAGTNQHCAFNDVRYMWMDGTYGNSAWVISGGDTVVIRGCAALPSQQNPDAPNCRVGWDKATGNDSENFWCAGVNAAWGCSMPQPPSGTASQHTRILGGCAYGTYSCNPVIGYPYTANNLTQLFGGFQVGAVMYLYGSQYVDIEGLEITTHNGQCTLVGAVGYPSYCPNSPPYDDEAQWGIVTSNTTSNITMQDVYIHGFTNIGIGGPLGGPFTMTRVIIGFNAFAGWNFDNGSDTPDAPGSSITANYLTVIGNGCLEEYPIVHTQFPAKSCWDSNSGGFGDGLSGQDTELDSLVCHHCGLFYNTKDAFIGPHTQITNLDVENSTDAGNMGSEWKFAQYLSGTATFKNNLINENCNRMSETLPGAVQNFNQSTGLPGSYLTNFCRAGAESFNYVTRLGSSVSFVGNTMVAADTIMIAAGCGYYTPGNIFNEETDCLPDPNVFTDNNFLGYTNPNSMFSGAAPALFYVDPGYPYITITSSYNNEYNIKPGTGDTCGTNHITCVDPLLVNEPPLPWPGTETDLDAFNGLATSNSFYPTSSSPLIGAGTAISGLTTDYYGITRPTPPTMGGVQP